MNIFFLIVFPALWGSLSAWSLFGGGASNPTLKLVHVLFRHGNRNPVGDDLIPGSPYYNESYYPEGYGQLTNDGKVTEYNIGSELRTRYSDFLTDNWNINYLDVRSTDSNRTKMSAQLMLAGLYPPRGDQIWSLLFWQPIPINYFKTSEDKETQGSSACSQYAPLLREIINGTEIADYLLRYKELFTIMSGRTGIDNFSIVNAFSHYFGFVVQTELGYSLEDWTKSVYPEPIHSAAVDLYYLITNTTAIRRIMPGYLLRKILFDTKQKINGSISPSKRKIFIYSAHEMNVASMLLGLDAFKITDIPPYGAYILFEVHEIDEVWGIKLFYQNYENDDPIAINLPGCDYFCPFDDFYNIVEDILPTDDTDCYGS